MPYSTKQQQAVLRCLEQRREELLTAADLAEDLRREGCPVGLATVYRQLEKLEQAGRVHKVNTEEGAFYQFCSHDANGHRDCFLLKCEKCGCINPRRTLFLGLCEECAGKETEEHGSHQ